MRAHQLILFAARIALVVYVTMTVWSAMSTMASKLQAIDRALTAAATK